MELFKQITPLKAYLKDFRCREKSIGLVPTMGALHAGHISLIQASKAENDVTISTIFVNPAQFNNPTDLLKYPRSIEKDIALLKSTGCDVLFNPENVEMYPRQATVSMDFGTLDKVMEGNFRPGHFSGVALVVSKLFNIVQPDRAYFGQKDWQQFTIIRKLTEELNFNIDLRSVATSRDADGLALSSRNLRLKPELRAHANVFFKCLTEAKAALRNGMDIAGVRQRVHEMVERLPDVRLEYFELADSKNLILLENVEQSNSPILCIAGYVGDVRLIDNMFLN